jgi:hypothetical protein
MTGSSGGELDASVLDGLMVVHHLDLVDAIVQILINVKIIDGETVVV